MVACEFMGVLALVFEDSEARRGKNGANAKSLYYEHAL